MALTERYTLEQKLGEGGFGAVFRGIHKQMSTPVAIKLLHAQHASSSETVARFEQEARRSAALKHPNTIRVFDFGRDDDGSLYLVMELLDGAPLSHHINEGRLAPDRVVHIVSQALAALDEAHQQGLVHRDLKPDNIFLTRLGKDPDFVKVLDFGIAKALDANSKLTASGVVIGTPTYMSPEQCRGAALDPRSDLYSLACIAYEMLAGRPPFLSDTIVGYIFAHVQQAPDLTKLAPNVPDGLVSWVGRCLEKDPADRFASADEAREALLASPTVTTSPIAGPSKASPSIQPALSPLALETGRAESPRSRRPWLLPALAGGGAAAALIIWALTQTAQSTPQSEALPTAQRVANAEPAKSPDPEPPSTPPAPIVRPEPTAEGGVLHPSPDFPERTRFIVQHDAAANTPDTAPTPSQPEPTPENPPPTVAPATQRLALSTVPTGATVKRNGEVLGQTPLELTWLVGETTPFKVELKSYDTATLRPTELADKTIHELRLTRTAPKDGPGVGAVGPGGGASATGPSAADLYKEGRALHNSDPAAALVLYRQAAAKGYPTAHKMMGSILIQQGDTAGAIAAYKRYLAASPDAKDAEVVRDIIVRLGGTP